MSVGGHDGKGDTTSALSGYSTGATSDWSGAADTKKNRPVPGYGGRKRVVERSEVLLAPEIANATAPLDPEVLPGDGNRHVHLVSIEETDGDRSVGERSRPD